MSTNLQAKSLRINYCCLRILAKAADNVKWHNKKGLAVENNAGNGAVGLDKNMKKVYN